MNELSALAPSNHLTLIDKDVKLFAFFPPKQKKWLP